MVPFSGLLSAAGVGRSVTLSDWADPPEEAHDEQDPPAQPPSAQPEQLSAQPEQPRRLAQQLPNQP
jgi:hypothetical protein